MPRVQALRAACRVCSARTCLSRFLGILVAWHMMEVTDYCSMHRVQGKHAAGCAVGRSVRLGRGAGRQPPVDDPAQRCRRCRRCGNNNTL